MMLRRRIEKLEKGLPIPPGKLLDWLERQAMYDLCPHERDLVSEIFRTTGRRKPWSAEHKAAKDRYVKSFEKLLVDVSDKDLELCVAQLKQQYGKALHEADGVA